ncbi:hypothetical protein M885DRAFT_520540 [Pelagophyceae sp. CCMP2097]|nr:hypothetical protein M885DRAFT_520540 [Pelagophyceae sp. CCMP2097]
MDTGALADLTQTVLASAAFEVARRVLCDDDGADNAVVLGVSCVVASDGCDAQAWHVDGGHVDGAKHLRAHCLNIFVPLVDVSQGGGTEFRPASHFLTRNLQKQMLIARARKTRPGRVRSGPAFAHYCFS